MRHFVLLGICFLFCCNAISAQKTALKWGKIPVEDLKMKSYSADPEAEAVILDDHGLIQVEFVGDDVRYRYQRHCRIKILKKTAFDRANIRIPYYSVKRNPEKITFLKAQTFSSEGEKTVVKNRNIVDNNINSSWSAKEFTFPDVEEGSILEYRYEIVSGRIVELRDWYFQEDIPVRLSELQVAIPNWFTYVYLFQGAGNVQKEEVDEKTIDVRGNPYTKIQSNIYRMENAPAIKREAYITNMDDYRARLRFQLKEINYPDGGKRPYLTNWDQLTKDLLSDPHFGKQFSKQKHYDNLINPTTEAIINSSDSEKDKAMQLAQYLNQEVSWNQVYSPFVPRSLNVAFKQKKANSGEFNLMLLALLREAKIAADPLLVSTRSNGKVVQLYPIIDQFNHVMIQAQLDGKTTILDASDQSLRPIDLPRIDALNEIGWLINEEQAHWVDIKSELSADVFMADLVLHSDGTLKGKLESNFKGYGGFKQRMIAQEFPNGEKWTTQLTQQYPDIQLDSFMVDNMEALSKPFRHTVNCSLPASKEQSADLLYVKPVLFSNFQRNPLQASSRNYPVEIPYPFREIFILNLQIPDGYVVEKLPEPIHLTTPGNGGQLKYFISQQGNIIQVSSKIQIKKLKYLPAEYPDIQQLFKQIAEKLQEQIVLKKNNG